MSRLTPMPALGLALAGALATIACTNFDPVDRGVCGNGAIEVGEDCDTDDPSCVRCAVTCTAQPDCPGEAYTCGADGLCYAPGGALGPATPAGPFQVNDVTITDIDRDGIGDAVGVSRSSISVRFGEPSARLTREDSLVTPTHAGIPAFGDLDGDGAIDITVRAADGIVSYGSAFGSLSPLWSQAELVDDAGGAGDIRTLFRAGPFSIGAIAVVGGSLQIAVFDFLLPTNTSGFVAPCDGRLGAVSGQALVPDHIDLYPAASGNLVMALSFATTPRSLCVLSLSDPALLPWQITDITPANASGLARAPVLADLDADGDACPSLINSDGGAQNLRAWNGSMSAGACRLTAAVNPGGAALPVAGTGAINTVAVGRIPMTPGFLGYASDMLVLSDGVYAYAPGALPRFDALYTSVRRLSDAAHGDLDGDGLGDAVLIAESEDDVDVLFRRPNAVFPLFPAYVVYRIDTASRVVRAEVGDYDGNGREDLALVEQLTDHQRLVIAYGNSDFLLPPVPIGTFSDVLSMLALPFPTIEDPGGVTDDLVMLLPPLPGQTFASVTLLVGSTQRTLIPFFDPRSDEDPDGNGPLQAPNEATLLAAAVVGRFVQTPGTDVPDLVALATDAVMKDSETVPDPTLVWRMPGTPAGPDGTESPGIPTTGLDCFTSTELCPDRAALMAWPISPTQDVVLAVDRSEPAHAVRFDPSSTSQIAAVALPAITDALPADSVVRSLYAADLDGDGAAELIVAASPRTSQGRGAVLVCAMTNASPTACTDLVPAVIAAAQVDGHAVSACIDAAPGRLTFSDLATPATAASDLVVACRDPDGSSLFRVRHGATPEVTRLARTATKLGGVRVGDVTGDGVVDVLAIEGDSGALSLVVFPQCPSRDLEACTRRGGS